MTSPANPMTSTIENGTVLLLERTFTAPRAQVFDAFSKAEHLRHWWGPRGWEIPHCTVDFRPGGQWHYCMKCTDPTQGEYYGMESWGLGVYQDIQSPERIEYLDYFSDAQARINPDLPATRVHLAFQDAGGRTTVTSRSSYDTPGALQTVLDMGMLQGISETWDRLAEYLSSRPA